MKISKLIIALLVGLVSTFNTHYGYATPDTRLLLETSPIQVSPLKLYWNPLKKDYALITSTVVEESIKNAGYGKIADQGYILNHPASGTKPLKLYWHPARMDYYTAATDAGNEHAATINYQLVGIQGYIYTTQVPGSVPLKLYYNGDRKDHASVATEQQELAVKAAEYEFVRIQGYVLKDGPSPENCEAKVVALEKEIEVLERQVAELKKKQELTVTKLIVSNDKGIFSSTSPFRPLYKLTDFWNAILDREIKEIEEVAKCIKGCNGDQDCLVKCLEVKPPVFTPK